MSALTKLDNAVTAALNEALSRDRTDFKATQPDAADFIGKLEERGYTIQPQRTWMELEREHRAGHCGPGYREEPCHFCRSRGFHQAGCPRRGGISA